MYENQNIISRTNVVGHLFYHDIFMNDSMDVPCPQTTITKTTTIIMLLNIDFKGAILTGPSGRAQSWRCSPGRPHRDSRAAAAGADCLRLAAERECKGLKRWFRERPQTWLGLSMPHYLAKVQHYTGHTWTSVVLITRTIRINFPHQISDDDFPWRVMMIGWWMDGTRWNRIMNGWKYYYCSSPG